LAAAAVVAFATPQAESIAEDLQQQTVRPDDTPNHIPEVVAVGYKQEAVPKDTTKAFDVVEEMPEYPGGTKAMMDYLMNNIKYPEDAMKKNIEGRVIASFVVDRDGNITEPRVVKSVYPSLDQEALRIVQAMPRWKPGKQSGKTVRVKYTLPIIFKLTGDKKGGESTQTETFKTFDVVEQMPEYPGGIEAMMQYLSQSVTYPKDAEKAQAEGRVIVTFVVDSDGSVVEPKVVKGVYPSLDQEALRVVQAMPKWTPGKQSGKAVRVKYTLPITFKLQGTNKKA